MNPGYMTYIFVGIFVVGFISTIIRLHIITKKHQKEREERWKKMRRNE